MINCPRNNCTNKITPHPLFGAIPCQNCRAKDSSIQFEKPEFYVASKQDRIQGQRDKYEKDMIPPYADSKGTPSAEFVKANPHMATEYFSEEQLTKL